MKKIVFICIFLVCGFSYLNALTTTWTGAASGDWHNPDNWDTGVIPDASTDVYVPNTGYYSPSVTSDASCNSLINQSGFTVSNGASLNIQNDYASNSDAALDVYGGSLNVGGGYGRLWYCKY